MDTLINSKLFTRPQTRTSRNGWGAKLYDDHVIINGNIYPVVHSANTFTPNGYGILPDAYYAYDPNTGLVKRLKKVMGDYSKGKYRKDHPKYMSLVGSEFASGAKWRDPNILIDAIK